MNSGTAKAPAVPTMSPDQHPIGVMPEGVYMERATRRSNRDRIDEIVAAVQRYAAAGMVIPHSWADELARRIHEDRLLPKGAR